MDNITAKQKFFFSSPLTHSDWMLHKGGPAMGDEGVRQMLLRCREFGIRRVYWRVFDSGRALYFSDLVEIMNYNVHDEPYQYSPGYIPLPTDPEVLERLNSLDYSGFDTFEAAVRIGHELGLEIYAWMTINEDDHGFGFTSRFSRENPEFRWTMRDGRVLHSQLSFAFQEVRDYKMALVEEMFAYDIDGIFLDWLRTGDIRDNPHNDADGVAEYGYELPNIESFERRFGKSPYDVPNGDEDWVSLRAEPITQFMRDVRRRVDRHYRKIGLSVMTIHPWGYRGTIPETIRPNTPQWVLDMKGHYMDGSLRGLLCDLETWSREGLIDEATVAGYYRKPATPLMGAEYLKTELDSGIADPVLYMWVPRTVDDVKRCADTAAAAGISHILLWEADYVDFIAEPGKREVVEAMTETAEL